jgi:hypothetical protein
VAGVILPEGEAVGVHVDAQRLNVGLEALCRGTGRIAPPAGEYRVPRRRLLDVGDLHVDPDVVVVLLNDCCDVGKRRAVWHETLKGEVGFTGLREKFLGPVRVVWVRFRCLLVVGPVPRREHAPPGLREAVVDDVDDGLTVDRVHHRRPDRSRLELRLVGLIDEMARASDAGRGLDGDGSRVPERLDVVRRDRTGDVDIARLELRQPSGCLRNDVEAKPVEIRNRLAIFALFEVPVEGVERVVVLFGTLAELERACCPRPRVHRPEALAVLVDGFHGKDENLGERVREVREGLVKFERHLELPGRADRLGRIDTVTSQQSDEVVTARRAILLVENAPDVLDDVIGRQRTVVGRMERDVLTQGDDERLCVPTRFYGLRNLRAKFAVRSGDDERTGVRPGHRHPLRTANPVWVERRRRIRCNRHPEFATPRDTVCPVVARLSVAGAVRSVPIT